jgi:hypothetical protein
MDTIKPVLRLGINAGARILLFLLFFYAASQKVLHPEQFRKELAISPLFSGEMASILLFAVPFIEIVLIVGLTIEHIQKFALYGAFALMVSFTVYILILITNFSTIPCACGGILGGMSYPVHIAFNIFFTLVALLGIYTSEDKPTTAPQSA